MGKDQPMSNKLVKNSIRRILDLFIKIDWPSIQTYSHTITYINLWNTENPAYNNPKSIEIRNSLISKGYNGNEIIEPLHYILDNDELLYKCCGDIYTLSMLLDTIFFASLAEIGIGSAGFDIAYKEFEEIVYGSGPFKKISFSHLYNLNSTKDIISFAEYDIVKLADQDIPYLTGENPNLPSFLHPRESGNYFLRIQDSEGLDNSEIGMWLWDRHRQASEIVGILKYLKDDVIHIDYTGLYFSPEWVNELRRPGIYMVGRPRITHFTERENYVLDDEWILKFQKILPIFNKYKPSLFDEQSNLRENIERAGRYYELSVEAERIDTRFIDLRISMEVLFSPSEKEQLSHSISENAAFLLGRNAPERMEIYKSLKMLYDKRSRLVHGGKAKEVTQKDIKLLSSYVRNSLIRFSVLQINGNNTRQQIHDLIKLAIFDQNKADELYLKSDLNKFLLEYEGIEISL